MYMEKSGQDTKITTKKTLHGTSAALGAGMAIASGVMGVDAVLDARKASAELDALNKIEQVVKTDNAPNTRALMEKEKTRLAAVLAEEKDKAGRELFKTAFFGGAAGIALRLARKKNTGEDSALNDDVPGTSRGL